MKTSTETRHILDTLEDAASRRRHRAALSQRVRAAGRDDPLGAVHRSAREPGHAGAVQALSRRARARAARPPSELEPQIHSTGFFRAKSKALIGMAQALVERPRRRGAGRHGGADDAAGRRPQDGERRARPRARRPRAAGRSARAARGEPHRHRRVRRSRRSSSSSCARRCRQTRWTRTSDTLILHGRRICRPKPLCDQCAVQDDCDYFARVVATRARRAGKRADARDKPAPQSRRGR